MTGPLAHQFAQVREGIGAVDKTDLLVGLVGAEVRRVEDAFAALSVIERRLEDMETALAAHREEFKDTYREFFNADEDEARQCLRDFEAAHGLAFLSVGEERSGARG